MGILDKFTGKKDAKAAAKEVKKKAVQKAKSAKPKADASASKKPAAKKDASGEADKKTAKVKGNTRKKGLKGNANVVIVRPHFTEKSERVSTEGKYTFIVDMNTNKVEVARAIRELYGVKPASVRIQVVKGKPVRFGRHKGTRKNEKKAIVSLKKGDKITVMEGV